jgi:2-amino-4-hydroxy-6-hydroxymethyldihydropteridine diphosphokinase
VADHTAWLLLGSNIHPQENLARSVTMIAGRATLEAVSSVWQSPPADGSAQPDYLNAAIRIRTDRSPEELLAGLIAPIERALGRVRSADIFAARTIDIDLALFDNCTGSFSGKPLPHPDILLQAHAALPLAEISPDLRHPVTGEPLVEIAAHLKNNRIRRREDLNLASKEK